MKTKAAKLLKTTKTEIQSSRPLRSANGKETRIRSAKPRSGSSPRLCNCFFGKKGLGTNLYELRSFLRKPVFGRRNVVNYFKPREDHGRFLFFSKKENRATCFAGVSTAPNVSSAPESLHCRRSSLRIFNRQASSTFEPVPQGIWGGLYNCGAVFPAAPANPPQLPWEVP